MGGHSEHLAHGGDVRVVAFSSRPDRFEWGGFLSRLGLPHVLLSDPSDDWYTRGVPGIGDRGDLVAYIHALACDRHVRALVTLGLSSGAYAALLYGRIAHADHVVAISPVTGLGEAIRPDFHPSWHHRIERGGHYRPLEDLRPIYAADSPTRVHAFVSDGEGAELDGDMCRRIGIDFQMRPGHSHALLARALRDDGTLERLLRGL